MQDKSFRLSVDDSKLKDIRRTATEMAQDMIMASRRYSTSSKEVLRDIEEQIRAIEKRNRLEQQEQKQTLERARLSGNMSTENYRSKLSQVKVMASEDKTQLQVLRDILDSIRATSKDEIRENRREVEQRISRSRTVNVLAPSGNPTELLRETIQRGMLGDASDNERQESASFHGRRFGGAFNRTAGLMAGSPNEYAMAAAVLALTPVIGQGLSMVGNRLIGGAARYEKGLGSMAISLGGTQEGAQGYVESLGGASRFNKFGGTYASVAEGIAAFRGASANQVGGATAIQMMAAERALGIDRGTMTSLASIMRYSEQEKLYRYKVKKESPEAVEDSPLRWTVSATKKAPEAEYETRTGRTRTGIMEAISILDRSSNRNNTILRENLQNMTGISQQMLNVSNTVNMSGVAAGIAGVSSATGATGGQLNRVTGGIMSMGRTQNPVIRSMMLRAMREQSPDASFFDIQAMMEKPFENMGAVSSVFDRLKGMTGGGELYKQALYSTFERQLGRSDINEILSGGGDFAKIAEQAKLAESKQAKAGTKGYEGRASEVVGDIESSTAKIDSYTQTLGKDVVEFLDKSFENISSTLESVFGEGGTFSKETKKAISEGFIEASKHMRGR